LALMTSHIASLFFVFVSLYSSSPPQTTIKKLSQSIINNMMTKLWCCWNRFVHRRLFDPESSSILHVCWWFVSQTLIAFFFITHAHNFIEWSFFSTILNDGKQTNKTRTIESIPFFFSSHFTDFFLDLRRSFFCESIARYMIFTYFIWFSMMTNDQKARQHTIWVENRSIDFFLSF
jgi:hypothetical protein